jgi:hypothetical protein
MRSSVVRPTFSSALAAVTLVLGAAWLALAALGCNPQARKDAVRDLRQASSTYYEGLRWKAFNQAAQYLPPSERAEFIEKREAERDDFHILDYDVRRVDYSAEKAEAFVEVDYRWHRLPSTTVEKSRIRQRWGYVEEIWVLLDQDEVEIRETDDDADKDKAKDLF